MRTNIWATVAVLAATLTVVGSEPAFAEAPGVLEQDGSVSIEVEISDRGDAPADVGGELPATGGGADLVPLTAAGLIALSVGLALAGARRPSDQRRGEL